MRAEYLPFELDGVSPGRVGDLGQVTITLSGTGLEDGAIVTLHGGGELVIQPEHVTFVDASTVKARFQMRSEVHDSYDVQIQNPGGAARLAENAITIETSTGIQVDLVMAGNLTPRIGTTLEAHGTLTNNGNIDAPYVTVLATFDAEVSIGWRRPEDSLPLQTQFPGFDWHFASPTSSFDDGHLGDAWLIRDLEPSGQRSFTARVTGFNAGSFEIVMGMGMASRAAFTEKLFTLLEVAREFALGLDPSELSEELREVVYDPAAWAGLWAEWFASAGIIDSAAPQSVSPGDSVFLRSGQSVDECQRWAIDDFMLCARDAGGDPASWLLCYAELLWKLMECIGDDPCTMSIICQNTHSFFPGGWCVLAHQELMRFLQGCGSGFAAADPNDKISPTGWGEDSFIPRDYPIPYTIRFENLPAATAAALKVNVTDQLSDDLDWPSFVLDEIGFAGTVIEVPDGLSHYQGQMEIDGWMWDEVEGCWVQYDETDIPLVPLVVDIEADIHSETGLVTWSIECADVNTGYFPEDPSAGFLPPNQEDIFYPDPDDPSDQPRMIHPGEGYLTYSVRPVADLPTGTEITNVASIVFDWNAAIDTPEVLNTIDAAAPTTAVAALPPEVNHARFEVCTTGEDDAGGCGIESYSVYVSDAGAPYTEWLTTTEMVCTEFIGAAVGHTYSFYSVARDHVGHAELPPTDPEDDTVIIPDATTTVRFGDFDNSGAVDLIDYEAFEACMPDPEDGSVDEDCQAKEDKDFDSDGDVDLADFASFQVAFGASQ